MAHSPKRLQRTHDELELVVFCLECLLSGRPALGAREKRKFEEALALARREVERVSALIDGGAAQTDVAGMLSLLTGDDADREDEEAEH